MKKIFFSSFLFALFYQFGLSQNTFSINTDKKGETTVVNDTMEVRVIDGITLKKVYKSANGKTLTIKERDDLFAKYKELGQIFSRGPGYNIVTLHPPAAGGGYSEEYDEIRKSLHSDSAKRVDDFYRRWMNKPIGNLQLTDIKGRQYNFDSLKGNVIVLNFWFTTCVPCIKEMPELNELVNEWKGKNVTFLGIALNNKEEIEKFLEKREFNYQHISSSQINKEFGIYGWPTHIVIDKSGIVRLLEIGGDGIKKKLESIIGDCLK